MTTVALGSLKVAALGAGYFSQFHCDSWHRIPEAELVAVCDLDKAKAGRYCSNAFDDLDKMLVEHTPDLLDIIVPPAAQADAIARALAHGVAWLVCQKPFCTTLDEARAVVRDVEAAGATLIVHENVRFQPWYRCVKAALASGSIGTLLQATFRLRPADGQGPRAYLDRQPYFQSMPRFLVHETAVHWVDTFRYLLGEPTAVYADLRRINPVISGEDAGFILLDHENGCRSLIDGNRLLDHCAANQRKTMGEAVFEGTEGSLSIKGDGTVLRRPHLGTACWTERAADTSDQFGGDCVHRLQSHAISGLLHGTPLENRAGDYLRVLEIEHAIYTAADTGQKQSLRPL